MLKLTALPAPNPEVYAQEAIANTFLSKHKTDNPKIIRICKCRSKHPGRTSTLPEICCTLIVNLIDEIYTIYTLEITLPLTRKGV
jgi:hypothetical protein